MSAPVVAGIGAAVSTVLFVMGWRAIRSDAMDHLDVGDLDLLRAQERRRALGMGPIERSATRVVRHLRRVLGPSVVTRLQRQINLAGRPDGMTVDDLLARFVTWSFLLGPAAFVFLLNRSAVGVILAATVVVVMPLARLSRARRLRQEQITRDLPDFLDVLAVMVRAGVAFQPAMARVAELDDGPLGEEVRLTLHQWENGASRRDAFNDLRERNDSEPLSQLVTALLQADRLGAPIADAVHDIALDMRRDSAQRQRRQAARAAPLVTLVTSTVLVFGALILVIAGLLIGSDADFGELLRGVR